MRADYERSVPVPTPGFFVATWLRLNPNSLAGSLIKTNYDAMLQRRIDGVWIFRINLRPKTITTLSHIPIAIHDARCTPRTRRTTKTKVVLSSAVDVVERLRVVGGDVVELCDRKVLFEVPVCAAVKILLHASVTPNEGMIRVAWVDPNVMVVHVLRLLTQTS